MRIFKYILLTVLIVVVWVVFASVRRHQAVEFGERVTLHFSTSDGPVVAQNVFQRRHWMLWLPISNERVVYTRGAAIVADFGEAGLVFGLLDDGLGTIGYSAFPELRKAKFGTAYVHKSKYFRRIKGQAGEPPREYKVKYRPVLVAFADINDPETMRFVDPNDLFGADRPGYSLDMATVQITEDEPDFATVLQTLPWLKGWSGTVFATNRETMPDGLRPIYGVTRFGKGHFIIEEFLR